MQQMQSITKALAGGLEHFRCVAQVRRCVPVPFSRSALLRITIGVSWITHAINTPQTGGPGLKTDRLEPVAQLLFDDVERL